MRYSRWIGHATGLAVLIFASIATAGTGGNCFSVMVGRSASASGAVLFGHNEDDGAPVIVNLMKVPRLSHAPGEVIRLKNGAVIPEQAKTAGMIWIELPGLRFADAYMNQYGVTIASNACKSRVRRAKLTDGGISYWLRRLMAERAHSAREAVQIGGRLVEKFGYASSGRTYCIADAKEAWMMAVVFGHLWVAERVPDGEVAVLANRYTIGRIDLGDRANFLGSPDVMTYAEKHGWYDPKRDGAFDFKKVYSAPSSYYSIKNIGRQWRGVSLLSGKTWDPGADFPFAFRPAHEVRLHEVMDLLRDHFEGTQFETPSTFDHGNPHKNFVKRICSDNTQYSFVAELRSWLPPAVGALLWLAPRRPCIQPFVPIYCGIESFPPGFARLGWKRALALHFVPDPARFKPRDGLAYWAFAGRAARIDADYAAYIPHVRQQRDQFQHAVMRARAVFERKAMSQIEKNPAKGRAALTHFTQTWLQKLWRFNLDGTNAAEPLSSSTIRRPS